MSQLRGCEAYMCMLTPRGLEAEDAGGLSRGVQRGPVRQSSSITSRVADSRQERRHIERVFKGWECIQAISLTLGCEKMHAYNPPKRMSSTRGRRTERGRMGSSRGHVDGDGSSAAVSINQYHLFIRSGLACCPQGPCVQHSPRHGQATHNNVMV